jgi:hypothetical protein
VNKEVQEIKRRRLCRRYCILAANSGAASNINDLQYCAGTKNAHICRKCSFPARRRSVPHQFQLNRLRGNPLDADAGWRLKKFRIHSNG